jgi:hypothetical protein
MSYNGAGSYQTTLAEPHAANNRCVRPYGDSFFNPCFDWYPIRVTAAWSQIVGEDSIWSKKYVVSYVYVLPDTDSVFYGYVVAYDDSAFNESVISDVTVGANDCVFKYMSEGPYASTFADRVCFD